MPETPTAAPPSGSGLESCLVVPDLQIVDGKEGYDSWKNGFGFPERNDIGFLVDEVLPGGGGLPRDEYDYWEGLQVPWNLYD